MTEPRAPRGGFHDTPQSRLLPAADTQDPAVRSVLLEVVTRVLHPSIIVVSFYLLVVGHHGTGGGFAAGLVASLGLVLRFLAGGPQGLGAASPVDPAVLLGSGLALMSGYATVGVFLSGAPLTSTSWSLALPVVGHLEVPASVVFEVGVYLLVIGLVLDVLRTLGHADRELDGPQPDDPQPDDLQPDDLQRDEPQRDEPQRDEPQRDDLQRDDVGATW